MFCASKQSISRQIGQTGARRAARVPALTRPARTLAKYKKGLPLRTLIAYRPPYSSMNIPLYDMFPYVSYNIFKGLSLTENPVT